MSDLYLTKVAIHDFRTFGKLEFSLPPGPGITLVVGPNGLGKSSFFDSIEWALTGTVRRFEEYLSKKLPEEAYLTRRGARADSHRVSLHFGKHEIFRDAEIEPEPDSVVELLKSNNWGSPIEDLSLYLAFTHFLGQSSNQRFTSLGSEKQWDAVRGPSGIDRLEEVRNALRGRGTLNAFNRRIERDAQEVTKCKQDLTNWQLLVDRASKLRQIADAAGALSKEAVLEDVARLDARGIALSGEGTKRSPFPSTPPPDGVNRLTGLRKTLEAARSAREQRLIVISGLVQSTKEYSAIRAAADAGSPAVDIAKTSVEQLTAERSQLTSTIAQKQEALRKARSDASTHQNQVVLLKRATADFQSIRAGQDALKLAEDEHAQTERLLNRSLTEQAGLRVDIERGRELETAFNSAISELDRVDVLSRRVRDIEIANERYQQALREARQSEQEIATMAVQRERLRQQIDGLERDVVASEADLSRATERVSEISEAISMIAVHISETDTECPLCRTHFPTGELRTLIRASSEQRDLVLASAQDSLALKTRQLHEAETELRSLTERHDRLQVDIRESRDLFENLQELRRELSSELEAAIDAPFATVVADLQKLSAETASRTRTLWEEFSRQAPQKSNRLEQLEADIQSLRRSLAVVIQKRDSLQREMRAATERLRMQGRGSDTDGQLTQSMAEQESARELLEAEVESDAKELENLASDEALLSRRLQEAQSQLNAREAEMESASRNAAAIEAQWKAAGMGGLPNAASLTKRRAEVAKEIEEIDLLLTEQERLVEAYQKALRNEELLTVTAQLESIGGKGAAPNPQAYEAILTQRLQQAEITIETSESAKATVSALAETLQRTASEFSTRFLLPLNDLIDQFNEALLSYPGETIRFKASHHVNRTKFDMQLRYRDRIDDAVYNTDLPPQLVLSEGQLAANGFSILCAASVAYPWSGWKALLLDDPLQHNDIIHAAAFVDLMRNLVERKGYQLLMSSHERSEAEFISRKFDAAGIPCSVLELTAPSRTGVNYMPVRYNEAAKAIMQSS